ncbi:hypothetical protein VIGAN_04228800, partial [Vigna angularis var. angularis]
TQTNIQNGWLSTHIVRTNFPYKAKQLSSLQHVTYIKWYGTQSHSYCLTQSKECSFLTHRRNRYPNLKDIPTNSNHSLLLTTPWYSQSLSTQPFLIHYYL